MVSLLLALLCTSFDRRIPAGNGGKLRCSQAELIQAIKASVDMFPSISRWCPAIEGGKNGCMRFNINHFLGNIPICMIRILLMRSASLGVHSYKIGYSTCDRSRRESALYEYDLKWLPSFRAARLDFIHSLIYFQNTAQTAYKTGVCPTRNLYYSWICLINRLFYRVSQGYLPNFVS